MSFVQQAIQDYRELTGDSEFLRLAWMREDAKRREAAALANAEKIGEKKGVKIGEKRGEKKAEERIAKKLLALDVPMDMIISACGMSESEINALRS